MSRQLASRRWDFKALVVAVQARTSSSSERRSIDRAFASVKALLLLLRSKHQCNIAHARAIAWCLPTALFGCWSVGCSSLEG